MKKLIGIIATIIMLVIFGLLVFSGAYIISTTLHTNETKQQKINNNLVNHGYDLVFSGVIGKLKSDDNDDKQYKVAYKNDQQKITYKIYDIGDIHEIVSTKFSKPQYFKSDGGTYGDAVIKRAPKYVFEENNDAKKEEKNYSLSDINLADGTYKVYWYDTEMLADSSNSSQEVLEVQGKHYMDRLMDNDHILQTDLNKNIKVPYLTVKNGDYVLHRAPNNKD